MKTKERDELYCGVNRAKIKQAEVKLNEKNFNHLVHFMEERFMAHVKKDIEKKPAPWTEDPIIKQYRFTNVFRQDDYVTRKLIKMQKAIPDVETKVLNTILMRAWNNPETFKDFGGPWAAEEIYDGIALKEKVRPVYHELAEAEPERMWWSSAYNQGGTKQAWKFPDGEGIARAHRETEGAKYPDFEKDIPLRVFHIGTYMKSAGIFKRLMNSRNQQEAFETLKQIRGFADFLAYQVFVDLSYIPEFPFSENEFTIAGPGCKRGLDYIFDDAAGLSYSEQIFKLRDILVCRAPQLNELYAAYNRKINVMSIENCMCEISKYIKAVNGTGRPRNHYKPRKGTK